MVSLFGKITAQAGQRAALVAYLLDAARVVGTLEGCYLYLVNISPTDADAIWVTEVWRSPADHQGSLALDKVRAIITVARPLIAGMSDSTTVTPVGGYGLPADLFI